MPRRHSLSSFGHTTRSSNSPTLALPSHATNNFSSTGRLTKVCAGPCLFQYSTSPSRVISIAHTSKCGMLSNILRLHSAEILPGSPKPVSSRCTILDGESKASRGQGSCWIVSLRSCGSELDQVRGFGAPMVISVIPRRCSSFKLDISSKDHEFAADDGNRASKNSSLGRCGRSVVAEVL